MGGEGFYTASPDSSALRFGDVIAGIPVIHAAVKYPLDSSDKNTFQIGVGHSAYAIVMSPCCSIRDQILSVCLLRQIDKNLFRAPKLLENPLLLNGQMCAKDAMHPVQWDRMTNEERQVKEAAGLGYVHNSIFVYAPDDLLTTYEISIDKKPRKFGHYQIDFRESCCIKSPGITPGTVTGMVTKMLELSHETRIALRDKLQFYYERVGSSE